jgi:Phosphotransferase system, mannose/fructose/N-acetylgalactosamine-specific component IIB
MIKLLRLDERLIHGQVAIKWSRHLSVDRIVVINDGAANNEIIKKSLMMAAPPNVKVAIKGMDEGIALLNDPRTAEMSILLLVASPQEVLKLLNNVKGIEKVNIGNYGRVAEREGDEFRKAYRGNLYLYDKEVELLREIVKTGVECIYQTTPEETPEPIKNIIK